MSPEQIEKWKKIWKNEVYNNVDEVDPNEEFYWKSLAYGFFIGKGLSLEEAREMLYKI